MAKSYVKFQTPGDVQSKALQLIEVSKVANGVRKGTNETTKAIERGEAKLVVIAEDVDPEEIVMHLPAICSEKAVPFLFVASRKDLGMAAGLKVGTAAVAITNSGSGEQVLKDLASKYIPGKQDKKE
ncbi:50S ribosomal protein L7ae [Candidatus Micrarchaeota archaeon]|nr:50S ribosomal protein L7ae [Candidatus Micrarchaeota archaeon]